MGKTFNQTIASIISYLFHPIWVPSITTYYLIQLYQQQMMEGVDGLLLKITVLFSVVLPLFSSILLKLTGVISSLKMPISSERRIPLFLSFSYFLIMAHLFNALQVIPFDFILMAFGAALSIFTALILLPYSKVSIHTLSIGSIWGVIFAISQSYQTNLFGMLILLSLIAGLVGFSRLSLKAHSPAQIYSGFLIGLSFQIICFLFQDLVYHILNFKIL